MESVEMLTVDVGIIQPWFGVLLVEANQWPVSPHDCRLVDDDVVSWWLLVCCRQWLPRGCIVGHAGRGGPVSECRRGVFGTTHHPPLTWWGRAFSIWILPPANPGHWLTNTARNPACFVDSYLPMSAVMTVQPKAGVITVVKSFRDKGGSRSWNRKIKGSK